MFYVIKFSFNICHFRVWDVKFVFVNMNVSLHIINFWWIALLDSVYCFREDVHHKFCIWTSFPWQCVPFKFFLPIYMLIFIFTWDILITFKRIFIAALYVQLNQLNRSILIKCLEIISFSFPLFADWNWLHFWFTLSLSLFSHHGLFKLFISRIWVVGIVHTRIYW